jgi:hypothetical protein
MSSGSSSGGSASAEISPQEEVILLQLAACYGMHEMARWLVLDVGKSPHLFTLHQRRRLGEDDALST